MPRTKARKAPTKRNRNSDEDSNLVNQLKEMQRMHDAFESESSMVRQERKEEIRDIFQKLRCRFSQPILDSTISDLMKPKPTKSDSLGAESSMASKNDDGYVSEASNRSSKPKKLLAAEKKRRSRSATGLTRSSTMSSHTTVRGDISTRTSRSKFRTPKPRLQTMSADRALMNPVTPKIQMNTPVSLLRYPKVGETIISMSGSPVIVNGGTQHGVANINIPMKDGMFSMQPNAITDVDSDLFSRIDQATFSQLKQLQANLAIVMSTIKLKK